MHRVDRVLGFFAALARQLRRFARQRAHLLHVIGALPGGRGDLFDAGRGLLQCRRLLLGAVVQIHAARGDLARCGRDRTGGMDDAAHRHVQPLLHQRHGIEQPADFTAMMARDDARQIAMRHAFTDRHRFIERTNDVRPEEPQRRRQQQHQQQQRHAALAPQRGAERRVDVVHIKAREHHPAPFRVMGGIADLGQRRFRPRPREAVFDKTTARPAPLVEILEDRQAIAVLDRAHIGARELRIRMHQQRISVIEHADVAVRAIAQLREALRYIALGLFDGQPLLDGALLAIAHDTGRQVEHVAQFGLALGQHLGASFPGIPATQGQHRDPDRQHEPQQLPAQA